MEMPPERAPRRKHGAGTAFHDFADPNLRRRLALSEIDKVPFGSYHVRAILVAGVGFLLDSYDIFSINLITIFLGLAFWQGPPEEARYGFGGNNGMLPTPVSQALKASASAGIILGQIVFGLLADALGRRRMYGAELTIIVVATLLFALVSPSQSMSSTGLLIFWRVVMGVGIGGDYPLSSVITSEFAPTRWRGAMMACVFSMQGVGQLLASIVALLVTVGFKSSFIGISKASDCGYECQIAADRCWRIIVGIGALPAVAALYYRITIPETPRYTFDVAHDVELADADIKAFASSKSKGEVDIIRQARLKKIAGPSLTTPAASWRDFTCYFSKWKNLKTLIGTTLSWFFLDLAFYGLGLNNALVLDAIGYSGGPELFPDLFHNAVGMIILAVAGSLPGYWISILTIDTIGRKPLQIFGFLVLTLIFCVIGFAFRQLSPAAILALYAVAQFFFNLGPNTTTFIVPGECFPTRYRATGHGLSAAAGKLGAIVAQVISIPFLTRRAAAPGCTGTGCSPWLGDLMRLFALFMLCGAAASLLIPETKGLTLEELAGEPPTSYNAGRNGSVCEGDGRGRPRRRGFLNPFLGGKPAGFAYPRASGGRGSRRKSARAAGVTMSATAAAAAAAAADVGGYDGVDLEMAVDDHAPAVTKGWGRRRRHGGPGAKSSGGDNRVSCSSSSSTRVLEESVSLKNVSKTLQRSGRVPGWNAGWGRIDRGAAPANINLQDVGGLIE